MSNALFIDVGSLNVLFKVNDKFSVANNYNGSPDKLITDAQALGSSFDVYLSMLPRVEGEYDYVISQLSLVSLPFGVVKKELESCYNFVSSIPGVNNIYLCNALANFIIPAKVSKFNALLCYGERYLLVSAQDRIIDSIVLFDSQIDFIDKMGEDFNCYGDLDLLDLDALYSQYPELVGVSKADLVPLVPLITSYHSAYKVNIEELLIDSELTDVVSGVSEDIIDDGEITENSQNTVVENNNLDDSDLEEDIGEEIDTPDIEDKHKFSVNKLSNISLKTIIIVCAFIIGLSYSVKEELNSILTMSIQSTKIEERTENFKNLSISFSQEDNIVEYLRDLFIYCNSYEGVSDDPLTDGDIILDSYEVYHNRINFMFSALDEIEKDVFINYLKEKYTVNEVNIYELGEVSVRDNNTYLQFSVEIDK